MEGHVVYRAGAPVEEVVENIKRILLARHGREDFSVTPQQQMLTTLSTVLDVLTFAVAALGGISLLVGAVGIITLMHISVNERVAEIGLLKALGSARAGIRTIFLIESAGGLVIAAVPDGAGVPPPPPPQAASMATTKNMAIPVNPCLLFTIYSS